MRFSRTTAKFPRVPKLPKIPQPRLRQPTFHVTAMVAAVAIVSAVAVTTPAPSGSLVGGRARPAAAVTGQSAAGSAPSTQAVYGAPTTTTTAAPPPNTTVGTGPGNAQTVLFNDPNGSVQLASPLASDGIPVTALEAYQDAANSANASHPNCHIPWPLLAGIGRVESDHGRYGGAVLRPDGTSTRPIIGIPLNGNGTEVVTDTDGGTIDGDPVYDRAVGPMQFIPSTWLIYGADGNGDGIKDPFNIFDAALAAANYLCIAGGDLSTTAGQTRAVLTYNHSSAYLAEVLGLEHTYASGDPGLIIPAAPEVVPPVPTRQPGGGPVPPPVDPGPPLAHKPPPPPTQPTPTTSSSKHPSPSTSTSPTSDPHPTDSGTPTTPDPSPTSTSVAPSPTDTGSPSDTTSDPGPTDTSSSTCTATATDSPSADNSSSTGGTQADPSAADPTLTSQVAEANNVPGDASTGPSTDSSSSSPAGAPSC
jgi:membrane-bound lytic murein transglycosylase B